MLHFLLVGNGSYSNRGCEAIVRGTMVVLRHAFGGDFRVTLGTMATPNELASQAAQETDPLITHIALCTPGVKRWSWAWWRRQATRWFTSPLEPYRILEPYCTDAAFAMQIGGDNYSLDYGLPTAYLQLDEYLWRHSVPVVLWGASVGPFEGAPKFLPKIIEHLGKMQAIFVRESESFEYLHQKGLGSRTYRMSDPAFLLEAVEPPPEKLGFALPPNAVGVNLSPLMAKYTTGGDLPTWLRHCTKLLQSIVETTQREVILIPHETRFHTDDHAFLRSVAHNCPKELARHVFCLGNRLTAAETKWVISRCAAFVGARMHAVIAATSSCVPTLTLVYSRKARGLNQDLFGKQDFCLQPAEITPVNLSQLLVRLLVERDRHVEHLQRVVPSIQASAIEGGKVLRCLIENR